VLIWRHKFPTIQSEHEAGGDHGHFRELFRYPHFLMAVAAQFMYVGAQVGTWSYFIQYVQEFTHQPEKIAGYFLTGTLGAFLVGRFSSAYLMRFVAPFKLLGAYALVNVFLVGFGVAHPGWAGMWAVFLTSFFMSLMFPTIFALGSKDLVQTQKLADLCW
jgi:FHS family L-fucose permease-like MFS transporter